MQFNLTNAWYQTSLTFITFLLLPFSWLFWLCVKVRYWFYQFGIIKIKHFPVPVIVVGNITVGGTGKTPFVIWLAQFLQSQGYRPGIVSRGVGGRKHFKAYPVEARSLAEEVGDEALLLLKNTGCPVVISVNRVAAVEYLLKNFYCDIVISDDGLQHYRLGREIEIALVDGLRRFGNKCLLPAGPLRESISRLKKVDFVIVNEGNVNDKFVMNLDPIQFISVKYPDKEYTFEKFPHKKIHAIAGIGHPERFFSRLQRLGLDVIPHTFKDHYLYQAKDFNFAPELPIVMTEKDAVKCQAFAEDNYWYLQVSVKMSNTFQDELRRILNA